LIDSHLELDCVGWFSDVLVLVGSETTTDNTVQGISAVSVEVTGGTVNDTVDHVLVVVKWLDNFFTLWDGVTSFIDFSDLVTIVIELSFIAIVAILIVATIATVVTIAAVIATVTSVSLLKLVVVSFFSSGKLAFSLSQAKLVSFSLDSDSLDRRL